MQHSFWLSLDIESFKNDLESDKLIHPLMNFKFWINIKFTILISLDK